MTTNELLEKGIGHNCLSDAYELGRADIISEIKDIIANYHAHIEDDAMADIFSDLEYLKESK